MIVQDVNNYFEVAVAAPIERTLTYLSPEESENELLPGEEIEAITRFLAQPDQSAYRLWFGLMPAW